MAGLLGKYLFLIVLIALLAFVVRIEQQRMDREEAQIVPQVECWTERESSLSPDSRISVVGEAICEDVP